MRRRSLGVRLLAATTTSVLFVGAAVALDRTRESRTVAAGELTPPTSTTPSPGSEGTPGADRTPEPGPDTEAAEALLQDVGAAADATADELLDAGVVVARGPWRWMTDAAWPVREERPVYVATLDVQERRRVAADVVIAHRLAEPTDEVVLRLLPAAGALAENDLDVSAAVDGRPVEATVDPGGLLRVPLRARRAAGEAVSLRIRLAYDLLTVGEVEADSGPAAFGIHGRTETQAVLGHWAPLLTFEPDAIVPWGDVGAFPTAIWSVLITHDATAVTGGAEGTCPGADPTDGACTWARGVALREVAVVVQEVAHDLSADGPADVRVTAGPDVLGTAVEVALRESVAGLVSLSDAFGPLPWPDVEVVAVPLGRGAAGMEFPGLVLVDDDTFAAGGGGFGTYVLAHELGHQWFHALVGNGSFADPVVDESLAQYSAIIVYRDLFGPEVAEVLVEQTIAARYRNFLESGRAEQPPATSSADFTSDVAYGSLIYARGALAWIAAEERLGPDGVQEFLRTLIRERGLAEVSADDVIRRAVAVDEAFGQILSRYWESPDPVPIP